MTFIRENLPRPEEYYEAAGLTLKGPSRSKWKTTRCDFHGGSDSMRINIQTGGFRCMACDVAGGDVLSFEMLQSGCDFVTAAKRLGAWVDDGRPTPKKRTALSPRDAIELMVFESNLIGIEATRIARGHTPGQSDLDRLLKAIARVNHIGRVFS